MLAQPAAEDADRRVAPARDVAVGRGAAEPHEDVRSAGHGSVPGPVDTRTSGRPAAGASARALGRRPHPGSHPGRRPGRRRPQRGLPRRNGPAAGRCRDVSAGRSRRCRVGRRRWCGTRRGSGRTSSNMGAWLHRPPMSSRGWPWPLTRTRVDRPVDDVGRVDDAHRSITYRPGAASIGRLRRLPSRFGSGPLLAGPGNGPVRPVRPPAAGLLGRAGEPGSARGGLGPGPCGSGPWGCRAG